jgi:hypothetical protein
MHVFKQENKGPGPNLSTPVSCEARPPSSGRTQSHRLPPLNTPVQLIPVDIELAKKAAELKASGKMSYADCFAAALAGLRKAELVTGDVGFRQAEGDT